MRVRSMILAVTCVLMAGLAGAATPLPQPSLPAARSPKIWVRILPFALRDRGWQLDRYNGRDVLDMIAELKPDVLSRFITGKPDPAWTVPMGNGAPPMRFTDYLTAAMKAGAPDCFLTPKVMLGIWSDDYRFASAQALHDMPVTPRLHALDLDTYFASGTDQDHKQALEHFKAIGWSDLGFNFAGGGKPSFGLVSYAMAAVNGTTGQVNLRQLAKMKDMGIATRLAHIDYPKGILEFAKLPPDRQADIIQTIARQQHQYGFTFIYPVLYGQNEYDSQAMKTKADGPYRGATIFQVIKKNIACDRAYPAACVPGY